MKGYGVLALVLLGCLFFVSAEGNCLSDLSTQIEQILKNASYRTATWGIAISGWRDGGDREKLFSLLEHNFRVPASNTKLLTTSALFTVVDVDKERFETPVFYRSDSQGKHLCIKGSGDPSLSYSQMQVAAKMISGGGFKDVKSLTLDTSLFNSPYAEGQPFDGSWQWSDITAAYGAHPNSAMVEENSFYVSVGSTSAGQPTTTTFSVPETAITFKNTAVTVSASSPLTLQVYWEPSSPVLNIIGNVPEGRTLTYHMAALDSDSYYISLFQAALEETGVRVDSILFGDCQGNSSSTKFEKQVGVMVSETWNKLFNHTLQESDNLYAESWLRALGNINSPGSNESTVQKGLDAVTDILQNTFGVSEDCHRQVDGSGLSVKNLVTPNCFVEVLKGVDNLQNGEEYFNFLPLAGESGTLSSRFIGTNAQGRVRAKTGTITGINALSGIVQNPNYSTLLFSIVVNESNQFASVIRNGIDSIVELLPDLDPSC